MQMRKFAGAVTAALAFVLAIAIAPLAAQASDQTALLGDATQTMHHMRHDKTFGPSRDLLRDARAILIVPALVKGGFIFGGEGGDGVLLERHGHSWSQPAFYSLASASFGLQIGLEKSELVMFVMSDRALRAVERSKFKFGAGAGLTVVTLGAAAEGATSGNLSGDIILWASSVGAYGGLTLNGSVLAAKDGWNEDFYGRPVSVREILSGKVSSGQTRELRDAIQSMF
ncbi:MAG: lipid-binding SYLF domain-containing protein [Pseudomonadota bacterium]|nr:lipid-binding SYLF domain-containing protein [Pseudomonadota bacterium]